MIMHVETKNKVQEIVSPPLPPAAVFDEQHMAAAQPVQLLTERPRRRATDALQRIFGRHVMAISIVITVIVIGVAGATASIDLPSQVQSSKDDTAQSASESPAPSIAPPTSNGSVLKRQDHRRRNLPAPQLGRTLPPFELDEGNAEPKPKARIVTVIH
jgi:hypothetical protein